MTRLFATLLLLLLTVNTVAQKPYRLGLGTSYGNVQEAFAINASAYLNIKPQLYLGADVNYFIPKQRDINGVTESEGSTGYNINLHYMLPFSKVLYVYPSVGANFTRQFLVLDDPNDVFLKLKLTTAWGTNLGGGLGLWDDNRLYYAEYKQITGNLSQQVVTLGVKWIFRK